MLTFGLNKTNHHFYRLFAFHVMKVFWAHNLLKIFRNKGNLKWNETVHHSIKESKESLILISSKKSIPESKWFSSILFEGIINSHNLTHRCLDKHSYFPPEKPIMCSPNKVFRGYVVKICCYNQDYCNNISVTNDTEPETFQGPGKI